MSETVVSEAMASIDMLQRWLAEQRAETERWRRAHESQRAVAQGLAEETMRLRAEINEALPALRTLLGTLHCTADRRRSFHAFGGTEYAPAECPVCAARSVLKKAGAL